MMRTPTVTEIPLVRVSEPYVDPAHARRSRPFTVTVRGGRTGMLAEHHRFYTPEDAWTFYRDPMTPLSFYDYARQTYADGSPPREAGEFMIGGYVRGGGVDKRGEFMIVLHDLGAGHRYGLTPQLRVFDDAYGALREATEAGLLDALESATIRTPDDLTAILVGLGFRDRSHRPVAKGEVV
jgi:hypothetical protein